MELSPDGRGLAYYIETTHIRCSREVVGAQAPQSVMPIGVFVFEGQEGTGEG